LRKIIHLKNNILREGIFMKVNTILNTASHRELEQLENKTRLFLVRHGELVTSREWRYVGHLDVELNEIGIEQMQRAGERLKSEQVDVLLSSDLKRTRKGAEIIGTMLGLTPQSYREFREISLGEWEGLTRDEIAAQFPEDFEERSKDLPHFRIKNGESFSDLKKRVITKLEQTLEEHQGKRIALIAHGGVNRIILTHVLGMDLSHLTRLDQAYGCLNIIDYFDGMPVVRLVNSTP
jgi:alpha-ribazole phosphatase/probable phosphoglycerate mutase